MAAKLKKRALAEYQTQTQPAVEGEPGHGPGLPLADGGQGEPLVLPPDVEVLPADIEPVVFRHR